MNRHNFHQFNPNQYKKYLSPFGQNVLTTLIKHLRTGLDNTENRRRQQLVLEPNGGNGSARHTLSMSSTPSNRSNNINVCQVSLSFDDNSETMAVKQTGQRNSMALPKLDDIDSDVTIQQLLRNNVGNDNLPNAIVTSSEELVQKIDTIYTRNDDEILTANDMITPAVHFTSKANKDLLLGTKYEDVAHKCSVNSLKVLNKESTDDMAVIKDDRNAIDDDIDAKEINWCDMFDTELFPNLNNDEPLLEHNDLDSRFHIYFPNDKLDSVKNSKETISRTSINVTNENESKRKQQTKITDTVPKKVKKPADKNSNLEKATKKVTSKKDDENKTKKCCTKNKNTKAIKKWLDNVDPMNKVEEETVQHNVDKIDTSNTTMTAKIESSATNTEEKKVADNIAAPLIIKSPSIEIETKPKEKVKKVIQSRLAQKDGKMKFGLPIKEHTENNPESEIINETKSKEIVKEKKIKSKFVPPIKSQIPVKNIAFDVCTIDESNLHLLTGVSDWENKEVVMTLVFRNGFCQLNSHHTEEFCIPDGIMIQFDDQFFYLKGESAEIGFMMKNLCKSRIICYNGKSLLLYFISKYGLQLKQSDFIIFDAKIGGSLIDPDNPPENFAELHKLIDFTPEFTIATECVLQKSAWYITLLKECFEKLKGLLIDNSLWNIFVNIEMRLLPVIAGMEYRGVSVDIEKLKSMEDILLSKMKAVEQDCYKAAGKTFQINSTVQVRTILYDELQLDTKSNLKIKETIGKGAKSTSEAMLRGLVSVHPLPKLILEYRHLHKAHATFLTGIAQHVRDGLVKPTWVQTAAATGRIASNNPNLQAIPKTPFSLVMFPDETQPQEPLLNFRSVYTSRPLYTLLAADFKHIECRVFAHAAGDATLLDALRSGKDLFKVLAAKWLNKPENEISSQDREQTKRIVYASLYGAGARKLMEILQVQYEQALSVLTSFNRTFPALKSFGREVVARATAGALSTLCGRARRFRHIASADFTLRSHAERQAVNFVVQGSAADLCKKAMVEVEQRLQASDPPVLGNLLLQIHDELVWEVLDEHLDRAAVVIKEVMENIGHQCGMSMALPVEMYSGRNWGEMQPHSV